MWAGASVHRCDARRVSEQLSARLASGGTRTLVALEAEGAVWVLAEKGPPRESLSPGRMVSLRRLWGDLACLGLPPHIDEALPEHWVLTTSPWEDGSDGWGFCPSLPTDWGLYPWDQEVPLWACFQPEATLGLWSLCPCSCPGQSTPRLEAPLGEQELWQPLQSGGRAGGQVPASLPSPSLVFAPSLPLSLCSSRLPLQGDVELTGHLPWARDGGDATQELAR